MAVASFREELGKILREQKKRVGSYANLSKEIVIAYEKLHEIPFSSPKQSPPVPYGIDRRKLTALADIQFATNVTLSMLELEGLEAFLNQRGTGLKDVFEVKSFLKDLVKSGRVMFLYGVQPRLHLTVASNWDLRSLALLMNELSRGRSGVRPFMVEVFNLVSNANSAGRRPVKTPDLTPKTFKDEEWFRGLRNVDGPSIVCLGSPVSCHATEIILAEMMNVKPFTPRPSVDDDLPFHFLVSPDLSERLNSTFCLNGHEVLKGVKKTSDEVYKGNAWGIKTKGDTFKGPRRKKGEWTNHGIIAAQRRRTGQVWIVVAGVSGPMTLAAARHLTSLVASIPKSSSTGHSPVIWGVVGGVIRIDPKKTNKEGDQREVLAERMEDSVECPTGLREFTPKKRGR